MDAAHGRGTWAEATIARYASMQHGVFSREQALEAGFSRRNIGYRLEIGRWVSADNAVYRPATTPNCWHLIVMAACLGGPAAASHRGSGRFQAFVTLHRK